MNILKTISLVAALAAATAPAMATAINGSILIQASTTVNDPNGNGGMDDATKFLTIYDAKVGTSLSGDYAGLGGTAVTYTPFTFNPTTTDLPINPIWTFTTGSGLTLTTYAFRLDTLAIDFQGYNGLFLSGTGLASIDGFITKDATEGTWHLSVSNDGSSFGFSSTAAVPDGGATAMLLGVGLLGLGALRRKS